MSIPKKVDQRIREAASRFRPILEAARARDVNEADTVTIVKGMLADVFGWDQFLEVTSEYAIRGTYVDLAVRTEDRIRFLIEVKAIGCDLRENHLRQAIGYASNEGIEWVILTNAAVWQAHRVVFGKPVGHELVFQLDFLGGNPRDAGFRQMAFLLTKEGMTRSAIARFHEERQALSRFNVAAIIRDDDVLAVVRRELRRAYPKLNPSIEQIRQIVVNDVLKREVVEGEKAEQAAKALRRSNRPLRKRRAKPAEQPAAAGDGGDA